MLIISLFAQAGTSIAKWGAYPSDTVCFWFVSGTRYVIMRLIAHLIVFVLLWPLISIFMTPSVFVGTVSIKSLLRMLGLIGITLLMELVVSGIEWFYLPDTFTSGWYQGSFILFEAECLKIFFFIIIILVTLWVLIARYMPRTSDSRTA